MEQPTQIKKKKVKNWRLTFSISGTHRSMCGERIRRDGNELVGFNRMLFVG